MFFLRCSVYTCQKGTKYTVNHKKSVILYLTITLALPEHSGPGGIEAYLSGQLASIGALTLLVGSSDL